LTRNSVPTAADALKGAAEKMPVPPRFPCPTRRSKGRFLRQRKAMFGLGCFWGAERKFWEPARRLRLRSDTRQGHAESTYREVCTGMTGHNEAVLVVFDRKDLMRRAAQDVLGKP
jgi:peptide-methionine (S)-S-oxide reductase